MTEPTPQIRPIALCVFRRGNDIFVGEGFDPIRKLTYYRPIGGGIEFGETSAAAAAREVKEEIGAEVTALRHIATMENIWGSAEQSGHEIVQIYEARFTDEALYRQPEVSGVEADGQKFRALWMPLDSFSSKRPLYPGGLLEILRSQDTAPRP